MCIYIDTTENQFVGGQVAPILRVTDYCGDAGKTIIPEVGQFSPNEQPGYPNYMHFQAYTTDDGFLQYFPQADRALVCAGGSAYLLQYRSDIRQLVPAALRRVIQIDDDKEQEEDMNEADDEDEDSEVDEE
ncbi:unnamed protein product [Orchesella dallaii]|uniref:Uncharacterized protein n=1 Tax=Orchesella dallaii TaxID=48710 RepID=A0ABP1RK25_9HEXA